MTMILAMTDTVVSVSTPQVDFSAAIDCEDVQEFLDVADEHVKTNGLSRRDAQDWIVHTLDALGERSELEETILVGTLLWLACRGDRGAVAEMMAKKGGQTLAYEIAKRGDFQLVMWPSIALGKTEQLKH
jgi:hypothetical protein